MDFLENLDLFTAGEFSEVAAINSATASEISISGIFDKNYQTMFDGISEGRAISFLAQSSKTIGLKHGDGLTIKTIPYKITEIKPCHDGALTLILLKEF
jgi:hypothetical protein